jgi:DNA-binding beta-propeller fold protein YncE
MGVGAGSTGLLGIQIGLERLKPQPATYSLNYRDAYASLMFNGDGFMSTGGTLTITAIDTLSNVISGVIDLTAYGSRGDTISVSHGAFKQIQIVGAPFGQGHVAATVNGTPFSTSHDDLEEVEVSRHNGELNVSAKGSSDVSVTGLLQFTLKQPHIGMNLLGGTAEASASYSFYYGLDSNMFAASEQGEITITKFDSETHRLSATFSFQGHDPTTKDTVSVTGGVIDNVLWFDR